MVRGTKLCVVLEKERRVGLFDVFRLFFFLLFLGFGLGLLRVRLNTRVLVAHDFLRHSELSCLLGFSHDALGVVGRRYGTEPGRWYGIVQFGRNISTTKWWKK